MESPPCVWGQDASLIQPDWLAGWLRGSRDAHPMLYYGITNACHQLCSVLTGEKLRSHAHMAGP